MEACFQAGPTTKKMLEGPRKTNEIQPIKTFRIRTNSMGHCKELLSSLLTRQMPDTCLRIRAFRNGNSISRNLPFYMIPKEEVYY